MRTRTAHLGELNDEGKTIRVTYWPADQVFQFKVIGGEPGKLPRTYTLADLWQLVRQAEEKYRPEKRDPNQTEHPVVLAACGEEVPAQVPHEVLPEAGLENGSVAACSRCKSRKWALQSPLKYAYKNLKNRAKQRGKPFDLTFLEYRAFALKSGYSELKGKSSQCLSIDRIKNELGYTASNIRAIRLGTNVRLFHCKMPQWMKDDMAKAELESLENERRDAQVQIRVPKS